MSVEVTTIEESTQEGSPASSTPQKYYQIRFRQKGHTHSACAKISGLAAGEMVMVQSDHGLEPATICGQGALLDATGFDKPPAFYSISRRANHDEVSKYENLMKREHDALDFCRKNIDKLGLMMKLIRVERYFNGSKIIFFFTAENRVDFRALVKDLVQEFRTRVEMRQIGVRHETQMLGGLGCCGRELCCASFMTKFVPVSIKMAKEQSLPLNPSKISGACNRLLCCLTHEFETYKRLRKDMPKPGKIITFEGEQYKVNQISILKNTVTVAALNSPETSRILTHDEWEGCETVSPKPQVSPPPQAQPVKTPPPPKPQPQAKNKKQRYPRKGKKPQQQ